MTKQETQVQWNSERPIVIFNLGYSVLNFKEINEDLSWLLRSIVCRILLRLYIIYLFTEITITPTDLLLSI